MLHARARRRPTSGSPWILTASLLLLLVDFGPARAGDWKGSEEVREGVLHVLNPQTPIEAPATIELQELWRVGGSSDNEDDFFGVVTSVLEDGEGNSYLLDGQLNEIKVYDDQGEWLRTIGRAGEGPGEWRNGFSMFWVPGGNIGVLQLFPPKIVLLTPDGEPAGEFPVPKSEGAGFQVLRQAQFAGDKLAMLYSLQEPSEGSFTESNVLCFADAKGNQTAELHRASSTMEFANALISEKSWDSFRNRWASSPDGRAFAGITFQQYEITFWNGDGTVDRVVHREYPEHLRTDAEYDRMLKLFEGFTRNVPIPGLKFDIEKVWNPISRIYARDDGTVWVQSSRGGNTLPEDMVGIFDIYDAKGRFTHQVTLKGQCDGWNDGVYFVKDRVYVITDLVPSLQALQGGGAEAEDLEEEPEPMSVICYRLDGTRLGMK